MIATIGKRIVKFNYQTGAVMAVVSPSILLSGTNSGPGVSGSGNVYVTGTFPGDPVAVYDNNLNYLGNVTNADRGFNRVVIGLPDDNTMIVPNYSAKVATVYRRPDEFSAWDSVSTAFDGMAIESYAIHPTTGNIWVSAGSPNDIPNEPWLPHTWYEFTIADALANRVPTPLATITWEAPAAGRPRAIAFSPDGRFAYVGEFSLPGPSLQRFRNTSVSAAPAPGEASGFTLEQNQPNPVANATTISFGIEAAGHVRVRVLDVTGREVAVLVDEALAAGNYTTRFAPGSLAAGVYVYTLEAGGQVTSRRMLVVR